MCLQLPRSILLLRLEVRTGRQEYGSIYQQLERPPCCLVEGERMAPLRPAREMLRTVFFPHISTGPSLPWLRARSGSPGPSARGSVPTRTSKPIWLPVPRRKQVENSLISRQRGRGAQGQAKSRQSGGRESKFSDVLWLLSPGFSGVQ